MPWLQDSGLPERKFICLQGCAICVQKYRNNAGARTPKPKAGHLHKTHLSVRHKGKTTCNPDTLLQGKPRGSLESWRVSDALKSTEFRLVLHSLSGESNPVWQWAPLAEDSQMPWLQDSGSPER